MPLTIDPITNSNTEPIELKMELANPFRIISKTTSNTAGYEFAFCY